MDRSNFRVFRNSWKEESDEGISKVDISCRANGPIPLPATIRYSCFRKASRPGLASQVRHWMDLTSTPSQLPASYEIMFSRSPSQPTRSTTAASHRISSKYVVGFVSPRSIPVGQRGSHNWRESRPRSNIAIWALFPPRSMMATSRPSRRTISVAVSRSAITRSRLLLVNKRDPY